MRLRTDTIGHIDKPTETDIQSAISYPGKKASENDLVKLMVDDTNYLCVWIGKKEIGHTLEIKTDSTKLACKEKFDSESAIQLMIKYFHGDLEWLKQFSWEKPLSQQFLENIQLLVNQKQKPEPAS
ncbi:MAG: hypothetical protein JRJ41_08570 [Deltaproteobacteria bacterium]|jgi:hypothetical protein|nr:hypothetical protein [Deltaproteobacteria bacterium]